MSALGEVILAEYDEINAEEFLGRLPIWWVLLRQEGMLRKFLLHELSEPKRMHT